MKTLVLCITAIILFYSSNLYSQKMYQWSSASQAKFIDSSIILIDPIAIDESSNWAYIHGQYRILAIKNDGTLWVLGQVRGTMMGDSSYKYKTLPLTQIGSESDWAKVSSGSEYITAIKKNGTLWAWGDNGAGQVGDGTTINRYHPIQIGSDSDWVQVECGDYHSMALKKDGTLWAWGGNYDGTLGDSTDTNRYSPILVPSDVKWKSVHSYFRHNIAIKFDGTLWAWGSNQYGQIGDGKPLEFTIYHYNYPIKISNDTDWETASAGFNHNLALKKDGTLWAWGANPLGAIGISSKTSTIQPVSPMKVNDDTDWETVSAGFYNSAALKKDGTLWAWGRILNSTGPYIGDEVISEVPIQIGYDNDWLRIQAASSFSVGLKSTSNGVKETNIEKFNIKASPNPFMDNINIEFSLPNSCEVSIDIYNNNGEIINNFYNAYMEEGLFNMSFSIANLPAGIYHIVFKIGNEKALKKVIKL